MVIFKLCGGTEAVDKNAEQKKMDGHHTSGVLPQTSLSHKQAIPHKHTHSMNAEADDSESLPSGHEKKKQSVAKRLDKFALNKLFYSFKHLCTQLIE